MKNDELALALTTALLTGKRATKDNADLGLELYRHILLRLSPLPPIKYRGEPGVEIGR